MTGAEPTFERVGEHVRFEGRFIQVATVSVRTPDGSVVDRDVVHHPGAVGVVPLHDDRSVTLVRQYRAPIDRWLLEIPAGLRDLAGEDPSHTGARELAEEVGLVADTLDLLCVFDNSAGFSDESVHVYLATGLHGVPSAVHGVEEEHLVVERLPLEQALGLVREGAITDAKTMIGLLLTDQTTS